MSPVHMTTREPRRPHPKTGCKHPKTGCKRGTQKGGITIFSAVLILILLTEMVLYAVQTGVFEQRKSGNELRQKIAFHVADAGIQAAKKFMLVNVNTKLVAASSGAGAWLEQGGADQRWFPCPVLTGKGEHPCYAESGNAGLNDTTFRDGSYFFGIDADGDADISADEMRLPLDPDAMGTADPTNKVELYALLCMLDIDRSQDPIVRGCTTDPARQDKRYFMITLLARGQADCDTNGANCTAEALVSDKVGSFGPGGGEGGPGVPLTARTNVPLSGTVEIVPNPNAGGVGVPISSWVNLNPACPLNEDPISPISGSYSTCERHEFYAQADFPVGDPAVPEVDDYKCPTNNCSCDRNEDRLLTYAQGNDREIGIDIVPDPLFPCDLWLYTFGIPKSNYLEAIAQNVPAGNSLTSCSSLNADSRGTYWISGSQCTLQDQVGTAEFPVFLIITTSDTRVNAGADVFGVMFVSDVEDPDAQFTGNGRATIYGAAVMDADMKNFNGTFQIVYLENVVESLLEEGGLGPVAGGWTDFHADWQ